jgi:hypothetical protein
MHKLVPSPSLHVETLELSLNEELPEKLPNLDVEKIYKIPLCNHVSHNSCNCSLM